MGAESTKYSSTQLYGVHFLLICSFSIYSCSYFESKVHLAVKQKAPNQRHSTEARSSTCGDAQQMCEASPKKAKIDHSFRKKSCSEDYESEAH